MAKPVEHSTLGAVATTGVKAGFWALAAAAAVAVLPFALGAVTIGAVSLIGFGSVGAIIGSLVVGGLGALATLGSTAGWGALPAVAAGGGILGAYRGISGVKADNAAYRQKVENLAESRQNHRVVELNNAGNAGMQQGYQTGFAEGQQYVVNQLRAAQEQMMAQQMAGSAKKGFADKIAEQRAGQAAVGPQMA